MGKMRHSDGSGSWIKVGNGRAVCIREKYKEKWYYKGSIFDKETGRAYLFNITPAYKIEGARDPKNNGKDAVNCYMQMVEKR